MTLRLRREQRARAWLAWHVAALRRMKRLPKLEELTGSVKPRQGQTWQEMRDIARMHTVLMGGKVMPRDGQVTADA